MERKPYPTNLTDEQWRRIEPLQPRPMRTGRPRSDLRGDLNANFYVVRTGCARRPLPHDFPPWQTVYQLFNASRKTGREKLCPPA